MYSAFRPRIAICFLVHDKATAHDKFEGVRTQSHRFS